MDGLQTGKFVVVNVNAQREEQASVSPVHEFVRLPFNKIGELGLSLSYDLVALQLKQRPPASMV